MKIVIKRKHRSFRQTIIFLLIISIFLLPSYLAIDFGGIMFSIQRILTIVAFIVCLMDYRRMIHIISQRQIAVLWAVYLLFTYMSDLFARNILYKTWLGIILEQYVVFILTMYYCIFMSNTQSLIKVLQIIAYILCFLGILEFFVGSSFYSLLQTTSREIWTGNFVRGGMYRIMGPYNHALAYGLILAILFPLACYNTKEYKIDYKSNIILEILVIINIVLTGSRSTILVLVAEIVILFSFSNVRNKVKIAGASLIAIIGLALYMTFVKNKVTIYFQHIFFSIFDMLFGSNLITLNTYRADLTLSYRLNLLKLFFSKDINPLTGNGFDFSLGYSIDNYYVSLFIKAGWLGLSSFLILISYVITRAMRKVKKDYIRILGIAVIGYCIHLFFVNELHTISALYMVLGMMYSSYRMEEEKTNGIILNGGNIEIKR